MYAIRSYYVRGEYVAKVARGHHKVNALAFLYFALFKQLRVSADVIRDLRRKPAKIDGVRRITSYNVCYTKLLRQAARCHNYIACSV